MPVLWDLLILSIFLLVVVFYHDVIYDYSSIAYYGIIFLLFIFATLSIYIKLYIHPSTPNKISVFIGSVSLNKFTCKAMIYNTLINQINKLIKKFIHSIKILYSKLFKIFALASVFNSHASNSIGTKQNLTLSRTQFHTFLQVQSVSLILKPYGLFIFSLFYSMIIRSSVAFCDPAIDSILPDMSDDTKRKNEFVRTYQAQPGQNFIHDYLKEFYPEDLAKENYSNVKKTLMIIGGIVFLLLLTYLWFLYDTAPSEEIAEESLDHLYTILEKAVQEHYKQKP